MPNPLFGRDLITPDDFTVEEWQLVLDKAAEMKRRHQSADYTWLEGTMAHRKLALITEEASTRTFGSSSQAMQMLGGGVTTYVGAAEMSSLAKGESFDDMGHTLMELQFNIIAMRHSKPGSAAALAKGAGIIPVVNNGDGTGNHPTQAGLDLMTVQEHFDLATSTAVLLGDLKHGRTVHSNGPLFARFGVRRFILVSPPSLAMPDEIVAKMRDHGAVVDITTDLEASLSEGDFVYITRPQRERFDDPREYDAIRGAYVISRALILRTNRKIGVMHPLPRTWELKTSVDKMPNALYWEQVRNGLYLRMAVLALLCNQSLD